MKENSNNIEILKAMIKENFEDITRSYTLIM